MADLTPLDVGNELDLRTNSLKKGDDMNSTTDPLQVPKGPITRSKVKKFQEAYTLNLQKLASVSVETKTFEPKNLYSPKDRLPVPLDVSWVRVGMVYRSVEILYQTNSAFSDRDDIYVL